MKIQRTERGFDILEFQDSYNKQCSLQKSSIATDDCIWLGVVGKGNRMHLNQAQVAELLPFLKRFVETGEISM